METFWGNGSDINKIHYKLDSYCENNGTLGHLWEVTPQPNYSIACNLKQIYQPSATYSVWKNKWKRPI